MNELYAELARLLDQVENVDKERKEMLVMINKKKKNINKRIEEIRREIRSGKYHPPLKMS